jgi:phosphonate transport system substrate-binding protein
MLRSVASLLVVALLVVACRRDEQSVGDQSSPVVMVLSPAHGSDPARVRELGAALERESGLRVDLRVAPNSESAVRMAGSPNTDVALLTLFEYLFCRQLYGTSAALRVVRKGGATTHHGEILVRADSDARSLTDLRGKTMAFVDRYSSTGFVLPSKLLLDSGVKVEPLFTGSHEAAIAAVRSGRAAAAATYAGAAAGSGDLRALARTAEIPNEPVFFRAGLGADKKRRLVAALERIAASAEGQRILGGIANIEGLVPTTDADYQSARALISSIGRSERDLVPSGWTLANEQEQKPGDLAP